MTRGQKRSADAAFGTNSMGSSTVAPALRSSERNGSGPRQIGAKREEGMGSEIGVKEEDVAIDAQPRLYENFGGNFGADHKPVVKQEE